MRRLPEFEKLTIRDFVSIDFECGHVDCVPRQLVVPREVIACA